MDQNMASFRGEHRDQRPPLTFSLLVQFILLALVGFLYLRIVLCIPDLGICYAKLSACNNLCHGFCCKNKKG
ncbi:hypothetical protein ACET3Z_027102 [Daucus carota]